MTEYLYACPQCDRERWVEHSLLRTEFHVELCMEPFMNMNCATIMSRKPIFPNVNWGGLRPSQGEHRGPVKDLIDTAPKRKDEFLARHEYHEKVSDGPDS